jgi:hypothetical protein
MKTKGPGRKFILHFVFPYKQLIEEAVPERDAIETSANHPCTKILFHQSIQLQVFFPHEDRHGHHRCHLTFLIDVCIEMKPFHLRNCPICRTLMLIFLRRTAEEPSVVAFKSI